MLCEESRGQRSFNRTKKQFGKDTAVQGTNDSSIVSKCSAVARGYFQDDFLKRFVIKTARRAPLINRGYYIRAKAVDHCLREFLQRTQSCTRRQLLSLGAGFDSLYFRLKAGGELGGAVVFEVDFPDVAQRKAALINRDPVLREILGTTESAAPPHSPLVLSSADYRLVGVDLKALGGLESALREAGLQTSAPTLLLSEVVLTYMDNTRSEALIQWASALFPSSVFVMYEQLRPHDPFGRVMQQHFLQLNSTLHALSRYPDKQTQRQRFLDRGWEECVCLDMNHFYFEFLSEEERSRVERLEPFDEYEEWHLKCSHYFILAASKGELKHQPLICPPCESPVPALVPVFCSQLLPVSVVPMEPEEAGLGCTDLSGSGLGCTGLAGFGLGCAALQPGNAVLVSGGAGRHGRGDQTRVLIRDKAVWRCACPRSTEWGGRMFHTVTPVPGQRCVVFGGRTSPLRPATSLLSVSWDPTTPTDPRLSVSELNCTGTAPRPRWRHSATLLTFRGESYLFVFGGSSIEEQALQDWHFLKLEENTWTQVPVGGSVPEPRHSHSACPYAGGLVIAGGLGGQTPLGSTVLLRPAQSGFRWHELKTDPPIIPRYSHTAHVIGDQLVLVGGIWIQADGVPGVAVINLTTGGSREYSIDTAAVPWPLMLHSHSSELLDGGREVLLIGGGGNCFSFGTHLNPQPVTLDLSPALD
ncbi:tRNA wybutosine-synthesizing protein 4 [Acipenser ruthenus]|uniref:tRNA wybutosine-synthesizing protein 4 n=1 Tax=Acipenser ruthenus TaxID=7906 RepID=UPI00274200AB|nr:tRNA wybutosine-synthesizing protein 4 [Acipenser ruthenus]XP_033899387.3 tRNA wybutosine-synthesizing protein 4 [Acipenser ruthenus]XP_058889897.1 tRNA wybutosine-synthesizing protein 4 [Acipenser ruthenus]